MSPKPSIFSASSRQLSPSTSFFYRLQIFFRDLRQEAQKVTWPSPSTAWQASLAVLRVILFSVIILSAADFIAYILFQRFFR